MTDLAATATSVTWNNCGTWDSGGMLISEMTGMSSGAKDCAKVDNCDAGTYYMDFNFSPAISFQDVVIYGNNWSGISTA